MINQVSFPYLNLEFTLNRVAFSIFGVEVYTYGLLIGLGILLAVIYGNFESKRIGIIQDDMYNMLLMALPASIVGARLYYVVFEWDSYKDNLLSILDIRSGGIAIYGGIIAAALVVFAYCKVKKISFGRCFDLLSIGLLIGQAVGRWGNFVNGEAFGGPTSLPWAMSIVQDGEMLAGFRHPTFLYESLWNTAGIIILWIFRKHKKFEGEVFCGYMLWYGLGRVWIEGLRADSLYIGDLRVSQLLSAVLVFVALGIIFYQRRNLKKTLDK